MAMKIIINETGERRTLSIIDPRSHEDWVLTLIGNAGAFGKTIHYDQELCVYRINQEDYDWWEDYLSKADADAHEIEELRDEYGSDVVEVALHEASFRFGEDLNYHHDEYQEAFRIIRAAGRTQNHDQP